MAFATLAFLSATRLRENTAPNASTPQADWAGDFQARVDRVTTALTQLPWPLPAPKEEPQGAGTLRWTLRHYDLTVPKPANPTDTAQFLAPIANAARDVSVDIAPAPAGAQVHIGVDGLLTHALALHWLDRQPRVAIIIDDFGNDLRTAHAFAALDVPLTFAVMPFCPFSKQVAELASLLKREVLLHLPMEAESGEEFGARIVLQANSDRATIVQQVNACLAEVPHAIGVNNHMGSRLTADRERMRWIIESLKENGLFFVDSRTTPRSVACEVASTVNVPCVARDLFLDDTDDEVAISAQLATLVQLTRLRSDIVAIGHPRPATLTALQSALPDFAAAGIEVVPISRIVADRAAAVR